MTKKVVEFTLPVSGVPLHIKRIGPPLANDIARRVKKAIPDPQPPMQEVMLGDEKKLEPNLSHPGYLAALRECSIKRGLIYLDELVHWGVDADVDAEAVAALRAEDPEGELPKSDLVVYVTRVAIESNQDMSALQDVIMGRFQPTEKAVAEAAETFPGQVQGT